MPVDLESDRLQDLQDTGQLKMVAIAINTHTYRDSIECNIGNRMKGNGRTIEGTEGGDGERKELRRRRRQRAEKPKNEKSGHVRRPNHLPGRQTQKDQTGLVGAPWAAAAEWRLL